jgi:hypothetical protein
VIAAGHYRHYIDAQTRWGIEKFVGVACCYRVAEIMAVDPQPTFSANLEPSRLDGLVTRVWRE